MRAFDEHEKRVIRALYALSRPASATEVAHVAGMSWNTAHDALQSLFRKNAVVAIKKGQRVFWMLRMNN
jgi:hypothetical protein